MSEIEFALSDCPLVCPFCGEDPYASYDAGTPQMFHILCDDAFCGSIPASANPPVPAP